jgi:mRNA interferase MazF
VESGRPAAGVSLPIRRGDVFFADLSPVIGSEQGGVRPVLILQNDIGNHYSPTVIVAAITSQREKTRLPIHVPVPAQESALGRDCLVLLEQIRTLDKRRLKQRAAHLPDHIMSRVDAAISISLGLTRL